MRMVIWRGMRLTLVGVALGLAAALALTRVMKNLLFEVSAQTDPATFALIACCWSVSPSLEATTSAARGEG